MAFLGRAVLKHLIEDVTFLIRGLVDSMYRDAYIRIKTQTLWNHSELLNPVVISFLETYVTWPMGVSIHKKILEAGKIHCYNGMHKIPLTQISPCSSSNSSVRQAYLQVSWKGDAECSDDIRRKYVGVVPQWNSHYKMVCIDVKTSEFSEYVH